MNTYPLPANLTDGSLFAEHLNDITRIGATEIGYFWTIWLFVIFAVIFIGFSYRFDPKESGAVAGFMTFVIALLMKSLSLISDVALIFFAIVMIISIGLLWTRPPSR